MILIIIIMNHAFQGFEPGSESGYNPYEDSSKSGYNPYEDSSKSSNSIYNQRQTGSGTGSGTGPGGSKVDYRCSIYNGLYTDC